MTVKNDVWQLDQLGAGLTGAQLAAVWNRYQQYGLTAAKALAAAYRQPRKAVPQYGPATGGGSGSSPQALARATTIEDLHHRAAHAGLTAPQSHEVVQVYRDKGKAAALALLRKYAAPQPKSWPEFQQRVAAQPFGERLRLDALAEAQGLTTASKALCDIEWQNIKANYQASRRRVQEYRAEEAMKKLRNR